MRELLWDKKGRFFAYLLASFLPVISDMTMQGVCAMIFVSMEKQDMKYFKWTIIFCFLSLLLSVAVHIIGQLLRIGFMRDVLLEVRNKAFDKILMTPYKDFSKKSKDVYISHLVNDINTFENNFFHSLINTIYMGGRYVVSFIIVCLLDYKLALVVLMISGGMFGIGRVFSKRTGKIQLKVAEANEALTVQAANTFNGLEILKLSRVEERFLSKNMDTINKVENKKMALTIYTECQRRLMMSLSYGITMGLAVNMLNNLLKGESFGVQMFLFQMSQGMIFPLIELIPKINILKSSISIYDRITKEDLKLDQREEKQEPFTFESHISVEDLSFGYGEQKLIQKANFTLEKGKKYLIKGASGCGKSTLMKLLAMIYETYEGEIKVDGISYKKIDEQSFNDQIAFVYQDIFLFEDTIANNISLFKPMPKEQIVYAAALAGLETFIKDQEKGLDTLLLENGKNLSGGQRQRIAIARAIAKQSQILFVDEATSALNEAIGSTIEKAILDLDTTVVAISHRYYKGITEAYDYVLELKHGVITTYDAKMYFEEVKAC